MSLESKFRLSLPADVLRAKYEEERVKRLRPDGASQYQELKGKFAEFAEDPYITERIVRDPIVAEHEVVILGGGFGGRPTRAAAGSRPPGRRGLSRGRAGGLPARDAGGGSAVSGLRSGDLVSAAGRGRDSDRRPRLAVGGALRVGEVALFGVW